MGASLAYMDEPIKDIHWDEGQDERQSFVIGEMQGWRLNMEDAAIGNVGFDNKKALFGVFDGHGGSEVAKYTKKYLEDIIRDTNEYKDRDYC
jgi:serine/threonine protein phosphatase PrpC